MVQDYLKLVTTILEKCVCWLFWTEYFENKFNLQLFYLSIVSQAFIVTWATTRCPPS